MYLDMLPDDTFAARYVLQVLAKSDCSLKLEISCLISCDGNQHHNDHVSVIIV